MIAEIERDLTMAAEGPDGPALWVSMACHQLPLGALRPLDGDPGSVSGFAVFLTHHAFFEEVGPLFDPTKLTESGKADPARISPADHKRAAALAARLLDRSRPRPTAVLRTSRGTHAFFGLAEPIEASPELSARLSTAQWQLARRLHGARLVPLVGSLPLPHIVSQGDRKVPAAKLLWADTAQRYDLESLIRQTEDRSGALYGTRTVGRRRRQPAIMETRTLPEECGLGDIDLPPDLLQVLADGRVHDEVYDQRWIGRIVRGLAIRRYGWLDVVALLEDDRFHLGRLARFYGYTRTGLRRMFRSALEDANPAFPLRLPYGIRRITLIVPEDEVEGISRRYLVEGGSRRRPFSFEVSFETLMSAAHFRIELGRQLGLLPYRVSYSIWDALIGVALCDPEVTTRKALEKDSHRVTLEELILDYAGSARALPAGAPALTGRSDDRWPILDGGHAVFPLRHLMAWLASRVEGESFKMHEITAAVRALGGDGPRPRRFEPKLRLQCWALPFTGKPTC